MGTLKKFTAIALTFIIAMSTMIFSASAEAPDLERLPAGITRYVSHTQFVAETIEFDSERAVRECLNCGSGDLYFVSRVPYAVSDDGYILYSETYHCRTCEKNSSYLVWRPQ